MDYKNWTLPNATNSMAFSMNNQSTQPEIIESCRKTIKSWCDYLGKTQCALIFTVYGLTPNITSYYRLKIFNGTNKIYPNVPIQTNSKSIGEVAYYWFISTAAMTYDSWHYDIGLGIVSPNDNADLFVSVMDGRYPTETDFDYKSTKVGADFIRISSNDSFFQQNSGWNPKVGVTVVIAVVARTENINYTLSL